MTHKELVITHARVVTPAEDFTGTVRVVDGRIAELDTAPSHVPGVEDWEGDYLLPGLVELHTDNLEKHMVPRPGVHWPVISAFISHDAQLATAGITTVLDAITVGDPNEEGARAMLLGKAVRTLADIHGKGLLRADHLLHLRCEVASATTVRDFAAYADNGLLRLVSMMDHTPGQRQWIDLQKYRQFYQGRNHWNDIKLEQMIALQRELQGKYARPNREALVSMVRERQLPLASHDDTTEEDVLEAFGLGATISEFPTSLDAARSAREHGMATIAGGPNLVRGSSHSGNVSVLELAQKGLLTVLSSDYMPASLLLGAFRLYEDGGHPLPQAIATVTSTPARLVGLDDRGEITPGRRADLIRVHHAESIQRVLAMYRGGVRKA